MVFSKFTTVNDIVNPKLLGRFIWPKRKILKVDPSEDPAGGKLHFHHKVPLMPNRMRNYDSLIFIYHLSFELV